LTVSQCGASCRRRCPWPTGAFWSVGSAHPERAWPTVARRPSAMLRSSRGRRDSAPAGWPGQGGRAPPCWCTSWRNDARPLRAATRTASTSQRACSRQRQATFRSLSVSLRDSTNRSRPGPARCSNTARTSRSLSRTGQAGQRCRGSLPAAPVASVAAARTTFNLAAQALGAGRSLRLLNGHHLSQLGNFVHRRTSRLTG
jgi:hypothetical protein